MGLLLDAFLPFRPPLIEKWHYTASLFLIPLISLTVATPALGKKRKMSVIAIGIGVSLILDFVKLRFEIGDDGNLLIAYTVYHSLKWMLPLMVWYAASCDHMHVIFRTTPLTERSSSYTCPLCGEEQSNIIDHIQTVHGPKSLKMKKVKKFIAQNPDLSA